MAESVPKQTPMVKFNNAVRETKQKIGDKRRKFRHCKSAPVSEYIPGEVVGNGNIQTLKPSETIFVKLRPSFRKVAAYFCIYMAVSVTCFYLLRNQIRGIKTNGILDSVYFCISSMTASGYTDLIPNSTATKLLACACVFSGTALIGLVLSNAADYLIEKQEEMFVTALDMRHESSPTLPSKKIETKKVRSKCIYVFVLLLVLMAIGTTFLVKVEKMDLVDAFFCVCAIITTLGYVDKSFSTKGGRVFAIFWILAGTICLARLILCIAELSSERKQKRLVERLLSRRMTRGDLEAADLDGDGVVNAAEFVIYKLKEMGKITEEDILPLMEQFEALDVDESKTLSASDLRLAQAPSL